MKIVFLLLIAFIHVAYGQPSPYDSLENKLSMAATMENKLTLLSQLVSISLSHDLHKALGYAKQGASLAEQTNDKKWKPAFYQSVGRIYSNLLQLDSAAIYIDQSMAGYKANHDKQGQAQAHFRTGWIFKRKGDIEKGMQEDFKGLRLMEEASDQSGISMAYNRLSEDLTRQGRLKEALQYAMQSIDISKKTGIRFDLLFAHFMAANVYIAMNENEQSLRFYNKAADLLPGAGLNNMELASLLNSRGNALKRLKRYTEALKDYDSALSLSRKMNLPFGISAGIANLGEVNLLMGNYQKALEYQLETVRMQERDSDFSNLKENYIHVSEIYEQMGDYPQSLAYHKKALTLRDSLAPVESNEAMAEMLTKYETEKKEATIASQQLQLAQQRKLQWLVAGVAALLAAFLFFVYRSYRNRTRTNKLLAAKNTENELLLKEIHHRVKNNLEVVSGLLALQSAQIEDPNTKEAMQESQNRVLSIGIVHQKLYQGTNLGAIEMKDYFKNLGDSILDSFGAEKRVTIECAMETIDVDIDTAVPLGLIVNEQLTNTLKYAFPKGQDGKVTIRLEKRNGGILHLEVSDNGVGKSGVIKGTGFGSQLISLLTRQLNGTMREENENGTRVLFDFKLD
ncbi:MAG TPA: histidine kinase dimerization/phosphoacceptor domain -containing protein [Ferruginibacter sp.]|nr:histidine kinase dimerization/phosphoacceptor domain -containing protein [Ferruginibacter sp.]